MEQGRARGEPSGQLASGLFGATLSDRDEREKGAHNVNMRGRGRAFGRNTTVIGPSDVYESNEMLVIWRSDTVAEEAKLRRTSAGRRVRPSPTSDRFEPPARDAHRVIVAFTWQAGTNPVIIAEYYLSDPGSVMLSCVQLILDTYHDACLHARLSESLVAPSTLPSQLS